MKITSNGKGVGNINGIYGGKTDGINGITIPCIPGSVSYKGSVARGQEYER